MIFKEVGYDEFLIKQIAEGRSQLEAGEGISLEQAKQSIQSAIENAVLELNELERLSYA